MQYADAPHRARQIANRGAALALLWVFIFALGVSLPTRSQNQVEVPEGTHAIYTDAQRDAYYLGLLQDRQDSQLILQSKWRDYRSMPLLDLSYRLLAMGRTQEALKELSTLLRHDPEHLVARWEKIQVLISLGRSFTAIEQLEILQAQAPAFSRGYLALGHLHMFTGEYSQAFADFRLAIETGKLLATDREVALAGAAEAAIKINRPREALNALNILRELGAANPAQRLVRADLLRNLNQLEEAQSEWEALSKLDNAPVTQRTAILNRAFLLMEQGKDGEAYAVLRRGDRNGLFSGRQASALEQRTFARALAASAVNSGHLEELLRFLEAGRIDFLDLSSRVLLAYALAKSDSSAEAEMALLTSDGKLLDTKASGPEERANYYLALADIAIRAGDDARAVTAGRLLIQLTRSPEYGLQLSKLALSNGWESAAIGALVELRAITKLTDRQKAPEAWVELLQALSDLARRAGDLELANQVLKEAEALMPNWRISAKRGQVALLNARYRVASAVLHDALARADRERAAGSFNANDHIAYARLLFDLAAVSAGNEDWSNALLYLIADWKVQPDPALILPAYLMLKESNARGVTPRNWIVHVFAYTNSASLSVKDKRLFARALLSLARILKANGDLREAVLMYRQSVKLDNQPDAVLEAGHLALELGQPTRALRLVRQLDQTQNRDAIAAIRCEAYGALGRNLEVLACVRREAGAQRLGADQHLALASLYLRLGDPHRASKELEEAYRLNPNLAISQVLLQIKQEAPRTLLRPKRKPYTAQMRSSKTGILSMREADVNRQTLSLEKQEAPEQHLQQLRASEIPIGLRLFEGISPSRRSVVDTTGSTLGIPFSAPFGLVDLSWRPPVIGYRDGRIFEVIARAQWLNQRYSLRPDPDTYQGVVGVSFKPLKDQNLKIGVERFFKGGSLTDDNWLGRVQWSYTQGDDFLPLYKPGQSLENERELYINLRLDGAYFFEKDRAILFYGDGRLGYSFRLAQDVLLLPFAYTVSSGNWNRNSTAVTMELGLGASMKWKGWPSERYGDLLHLDLFGRVGYEVLNTSNNQDSRALLGLQIKF